MEFSTQLRLVRALLNWRQTKMAEAFDVTPETVSLWENGQREPRDIIKRMLIVLAERNDLVWNDRGYPEYAENGPILTDAELPEELRGLSCVQILSDKAINACGVYFLVLGGRVVYVGKSIDSGKRVLEHIQAKKYNPALKNFDRVLFIRWSPSDLDRVESALIRLLRPRFNRIIPKEQVEGSDEDVFMALSNKGAEILEEKTGWPWDRMHLFPLTRRDPEPFDPWQEREKIRA